MDNTDYKIVELNLQPRPESGFDQESCRYKGMIPHQALPVEFRDDGKFATAILYGNFDIHRLGTKIEKGIRFRQAPGPGQEGV